MFPLNPGKCGLVNGHEVFQNCRNPFLIFSKKYFVIYSDCGSGGEPSKHLITSTTNTGNLIVTVVIDIFAVLTRDLGCCFLGESSVDASLPFFSFHSVRRKAEAVYIKMRPSSHHLDTLLNVKICTEPIYKPDCTIPCSLFR